MELVLIDDRKDCALYTTFVLILKILFLLLQEVVITRDIPSESFGTHFYNDHLEEPITHALKEGDTFGHLCFDIGYIVYTFVTICLLHINI